MPDTPRRLVFSDVDETLISGKSLFDFLDFYFAARHGTDGALHAAGTRRRIAALVAGAPRARWETARTTRPGGANASTS